MEKAVEDRRKFLADAGLAAAAMICGGASVGQAAEPGDSLHVSINQWSVGAIRGRDKQKAKVSFDEELAELAASGINGLEPALVSANQVGPLVAQLRKHGLELRSIYTGSTLDDPAKAGKEVERVVALAKSRQGGGNEDHRDESQPAAESPGEERRATEGPSGRPRQRWGTPWQPSGSAWRTTTTTWNCSMRRGNSIT